MLMWKSKHRQIMADSEAKLAIRLENNNGLRKQLADARRLLEETLKQSRELLEMIAAMKPYYELGRKRRANMDADNARRRAARVAK